MPPGATAAVQCIVGCVISLASHKLSQPDMLHMPSPPYIPQSKLLSAVTLVDKYGHEGLWHRITRFESKQQVAAKFSGTQQELHDISQNVSYLKVAQGGWACIYQQMYLRAAA